MIPMKSRYSLETFLWEPEIRNKIKKKKNQEKKNFNIKPKQKKVRAVLNRALKLRHSVLIFRKIKQLF